MRHVVPGVLALGLMLGCQKQAEQKPQTQTPPPAQQSAAETPQQESQQAREATPPSPAPRMSMDSKIWMTSAEGKPGQQVKLDVHYRLSEPAKTIVVPLTFLGNAAVDSFSWVGSSLAGYQMRPVNIRNDLKIFLAAVVPLTEPDIPADSGFLGSIWFTIDKDAPAQTVVVETTFVYPGNTLQYVDTLIGSVTPQWQAGSIKVVK